jgi:F-type H+-transporting ATPase subunit b
VVPGTLLERFTPSRKQKTMDETLRQIGGLLLDSIPTIIFFLLLFGLYTLLVHRPLGRVLAERHARTAGAIEKARADVASAEARTAEYEQKLRDARLALLKAQDSRRAAATQARAAAVAEARDRAKAQVDEARAGIDQEKQAAKVTLESQAGQLASQIIRTVLEPQRAGGR